MPQVMIDATSFSELDRALTDLRVGSETFATLPLASRLVLLEQAMDGVMAVAEDWVNAGCEAKGLKPTEPVGGEEWLGGPMVTMRNLRLLRQTLMDVRDYGKPRLPDNAVRVTGAGQTVAKVFPAEAYDKLLFQGFSAEIYMEPGVTPETLQDTMAVAYRTDGDAPVGTVSLVLGAGNVSSIGPMDVLYKLFAENEVVILKMNPVNEYIGPFVEKAFASMVEGGFLRVVYGGAGVGEYLCKHEGVDTIHITGSDKTHDIIVWGPPGPERDQRMAAGEPLNAKPITSELGNVSPIVVVPGPWSPAQIQFQAENIATMVANNGSFNCNAAKLIVLPEGWDKAEALMDAVARTLQSAPRRQAYYPGAHQRYDSFLAAHPEAKAVGARTDDVVPWTLIRNVDSANEDEICFSTEAFCGVLADTSLPAETPAAFLAEAARFCNERVWGTLNVSILIDPKTQKQPEVAAALETAIEDLRYGTVMINHWAGLCYGLVNTTWGAHPGHTLADIQSGRGVVHNAYLFDKPQKSVIRGPFVVKPRPPWFVTNKRTHKIGRHLTAFERQPSITRLPFIIGNSLLG